MNQTKFRPSILNSCCVSDCEMILDELVEEIDDRVAICEEKQDQFPILNEEFHGKITALLELKIHLVEKKREVRERYKRNRKMWTNRKTL